MGGRGGFHTSGCCDAAHPVRRPPSSTVIVVLGCRSDEDGEGQVLPSPLEGKSRRLSLGGGWKKDWTNRPFACVALSGVGVWRCGHLQSDETCHQKHGGDQKDPRGDEVPPWCHRSRSTSDPWENFGGRTRQSNLQNRALLSDFLGVRKKNRQGRIHRTKREWSGAGGGRQGRHRYVPLSLRSEMLAKCRN
jgi:hypothetical protein